MIRRPPRSTQSRSSAASDVYKRQAPAVRGLELLAVHVRHQPHVALPAHRARAPGVLAHMAAGAQELGMGVADIEPGERAAAKVTDHGPTGQGVVDVPGHGSECTRVPRATRAVTSSSRATPPRPNAPAPRGS